jgi:hypothetical protein
MANPIELLSELTVLESKLVSGSVSSDMEMILLAQRRNEIVELLIAFKVLTGFYNDRLEAILKVDTEAGSLCKQYQEYNDGNLDRDNSRGSVNSRLAILKRGLSSSDGAPG